MGTPKNDGQDTADLDFDLENPDLPKSISKAALTSDNYPYDERMDRDLYEEQLSSLQRELVKLQTDMGKIGQRIAILFEGRDSAGKGGTIKRIMEHLNPRTNKVVALAKPSDRERGQWYFQRYVSHLPPAGEMALFDRSWYNRAGVEPVMGFCTEAEHETFLQQAPRFEHMLVDGGIHLFKFWLEIGREMQLKRFHDRRHDPVKVWKLSPIDLQALDRWDAYTKARDQMLPATDTPHAPWTIVRANDKRRARINVIRSILTRVKYEGRDFGEIGNIDHNIVLSPPQYLSL
jgi:polyphosphate kinase 2